VRQQKRRVLGSVVLGLGAALAIAGCGAGQITQTDTQQPAVNGAYAQAGRVLIRDAALQFPQSGQQAYAAGSNAPLSLVIVNQEPTDDELVSVSSPLASGAQIEGSKVIVAGSYLVVGGQEGGAGAETSAAQPSSATAAAAASGGVKTPEKMGHATVVLQGLRTNVWAGMTVPVTFTFRNAGQVTVELPIAAPAYPRTPAPQAEHAEGGH
jgi:copper(I)-binding protein